MQTIDEMEYEETKQLISFRAESQDDDQNGSQTLNEDFESQERLS